MAHTYVDTRQTADQGPITALAHAYLNDADRKMLHTELGIPFDNLKFSSREYFALLELFPKYVSFYRRHMVLYRFILTIDAVLRDLRSLERLLESLDTIGLDSVFIDLQYQLPHPMYVPWDIALNDAFQHEWNVRDQAALSLRTPTTKRDKWIALLYMLRFPTVRGIMALTQGLHYSDPELNNKRWINAGSVWDLVNGDRCASPLGLAADENGSIFTETRKRLKLAEGKDSPEFLSSPLGGPMMPWIFRPKEEERTDKELYESLAKFVFKRGPGVLVSQFADDLGELRKVFRRTGMRIYIYKLWNKCMQKWLAVLARTAMTLSDKPVSFAGDLLRGPFIGSSLKCEDGTVASFKSWDGRDLRYEDAVTEINGMRYVSGMVDPRNSGCVQQIELKTRTRRRKRTTKTKSKSKKK